MEGTLLDAIKIIERHSKELKIIKLMHNSNEITENAHSVTTSCEYG